MQEAIIYRTPRSPNYYGLAKARALTTEALKALWDSYDGITTSRSDISAEAVHFVLNERGEGDHCAI